MTSNAARLATCYSGAVYDTLRARHRQHRPSQGDHIIADIDGAVIIPGACADRVVAEVEAVMQAENNVRDAIRSGIDQRYIARKAHLPSPSVGSCGR